MIDSGMRIISRLLLITIVAEGWTIQPQSHRPCTQLKAAGGFLDGLNTVFNNNNKGQSSSRFCKAKELMKDLVQEERCFATDAGALTFGEACAINVVYEDCFEPQPFVGKTVSTARRV